MSVRARPKALSDLVRMQLEAGHTTLRATGTSMLPLIPPNTEITVEPFQPESLKVGDVICFETLSGNLVVHRFLGFAPRDRRLLTRGDWRPRFDDPVGLEAVVGRVTGVSRRFWRVLNGAYILVLVWPGHLIMRLFGRRWVEEIYGILLGTARLVRWMWSQVASLSVEVVRADWNSELVAELCDLESSEVVAAVDNPARWLCLMASSDGRPMACALCYFDDAGCSVEAFGHSDPDLGKQLFDTLNARLFGFRRGRLLTLRRGAFKSEWRRDEQEWLLERGFVSGADGLVFS